MARSYDAVDDTMNNNGFKNEKTKTAWHSHQNMVDAESGVLNAKVVAEAYAELFEEARKTFIEANNSAEIARKTAEAVANNVLEMANANKKIVDERDTKRSSYREAYKIAKENDANQNQLNKIQREGKKQEAEDNKKLYTNIAKDAKDNFKDMAKGIFTSIGDGGQGFREALDGLKANFEELSKAFGGKTAAVLVGFASAAGKASNALSGFADGLKSLIKQIGSYKSAWDTRLFGSDKGHSSISDLVKNVIGVSPYVKQASVMEKLNTAISEGINYNVEQRAFLDVLSDTVATTFDAFDQTLKDLVRVQQQDSTAYRLGMEASLTEYLNRMFETTEYLNSLSDSVTASLYEATSLLNAADAIGYEYQVQKWLGSLYSVGMSNSAIQSISDSLGKLLAGDISATESGTGKLLVMAAANSGLDYAKLLTDGINESDVNLLLESMVNYLQQIADDNKVVQSQMANIFGLKTSDIEAASNLTGLLGDILGTQDTYGAGTAYGKLTSMVNSMINRISMGEFIDNISDNFKYTLAEGIAANPALYGMLSVGDLLKETVGGINIPAISVMGNMVDLETTVADLLKAGAMGGSILRGIPALFTGLGQIGTGFGSAFKNMMAQGSSTVSVGSGSLGDVSIDTSGLSITKYKANQSGDDYTESNNALIEDSKNEASPKANNTEDMRDTNDLYDNGQTIIEYLKKMVDEKEPIVVEVNNMPSGDYFNSWLETGHGPAKP